MTQKPVTVRGRGAGENPPNRFEKIHLERFEDYDPSEDPAPQTQFLTDNSQTIITYNNSPDVGFDASVNPYRGCEHGCSYCYARNTHEYLGFSAGLDFESKIMVKLRAAELLRAELSSPKWQPQVLAMSGVTDCYQPAERRFQITRACLAVLAEFRNPVGIITKNHLVTRDIDYLRKLAAHDCVAVNLSINSLNRDLARQLEPRASLPAQRLAAVETLANAGIPVGIIIGPIIPALNDHEIPAVLTAAKNAGAKWAHKVVLRLPLTVLPVFEQWLKRTYPEKEEKILSRIRAIRGGKLNDARFGSRMRGEGILADQINQIFHVAHRKAGFTGEDRFALSTENFRRPQGPQMELGL
jgi:DNA repair photolyase